MARFSPKDPLEYLNSKISIDLETGCWNWTGSVFAGGYGYFKCKALGTAMNASRASWILHYGWPGIGAYVCHRCDNPGCCNPAHLFLGTPQDNVDDMVRKERNSRGEDRPASKLKEGDVKEIRRLRGNRGDKDRVKIKELAGRFGVSPHTIKQVIYGKTWTHVD